VSISQLLYEPTTKILLSKYGGLGILGNYEMASRLVNQVRALIVNANQVVIPIIAENLRII
jgi:O-antigen/teichoic acid export membrane protein